MLGRGDYEGHDLQCHCYSRTVDGVLSSSDCDRYPQTQQGGAVSIEGSVHLSNLKLLCPRTDKPVRTKQRVVEKEVGGRTKVFRERISIVDNESVERT